MLRRLTRTPLAALALVLCLGSSFSHSLAPRDAASTEVMVLGTYHFANPGLDMINAQVDDVLSDHRQVEIEAVVEALADFMPTKILLELPPSAEAAFNERYQRFQDGSLELGRNEHDQIGLRLASMLDHERIYGIDSKQDLDLEGVMEHAGMNGQEAVADRLVQLLEEVQTAVARVHAPGRSTAQMLRSHNGGDELMASGLDSALYMLLAEVGDSENPIGANVVADWHARNLRIFGNLLRCIEEGDERVLVLYGSGHRALLSQYVREHSDLELVSALEFLPEE